MGDSRLSPPNVKFEMSSGYPNGKDKKLYVQVLSSVAEVRTVDVQVRITGIHTALKAAGARVITREEPIVKEGSQGRVLERTGFGGGMWAPAAENRGQQPVSKGELQKSVFLEAKRKPIAFQTKQSGKRSQMWPRDELGRELNLVMWKSSVTSEESVSLFISWA